MKRKVDNQEKELQKIEKRDNGTFIKIVSCLICALVIFILLVNVEKNMMTKYEKTDIVVCTKDLNYQSDVTKKNRNEYFKVVQVPISIVPKNAIKSIKNIPEGLTSKNLYANEVLLTDYIISNDSIVKDIKDPVITSISLKSLDKAVGGVLRKGDLVNISVISSDDDKKTTLLEKVHIVKAMNGSGEVLTKDSEDAATVFNIIVNRKDAQMLKKVVDQNKELTLVKVNDVRY